MHPRRDAFTRRSSGGGGFWPSGNDQARSDLDAIDDKAGKDDQTETKAAGHGRISNGKNRDPSTRLHSKRVRAPVGRRLTVKAAREAWFDGQIDLDPARLVFLDETWTSTNMIRRYGWAPRGERCQVAVPHGHVWTPHQVQAKSLNRRCA